MSNISGNETSTCVYRDHVRKAWQEFLERTQSTGTSSFNKQEIAEIEEEITNWELFYDSKVQTRKPSELCVCYLAGDNPLNDFDVFVDNGVLPQNMLAIEKDPKTCQEAKKNMNQAKETPHFFEGSFLDLLRDSSEGPFDIIYFDACGSLPSLKQETLKAIGYVFLYNKLKSPGALITTFSFPPKQTERAASDASPQDTERESLKELSREYLKYRLVNTATAHKIPHFNEEFLNKRTDEENYSEYLVYQIIDTAYMYIPAHRMLSPKRNSLLKQSFVNKGALLKAIEKLLPQVMAEGEESASKLWSVLRELESLMAEECLIHEQMENQKMGINLQIEIKHLQIRMRKELLSISRLFNSLILAPEERQFIQEEEQLEQQILQKWKALEELEEKQSQADQLLQERKSKMDKLEQDKKKTIQDLSVHEAQPPRNLSQLGHHLQSRTSSNPLWDTWASEVFPDWKSTDLKKWEISLLLMTHLLTNWIAFIKKCFKKDFKDCLGLIIKSLGGDGEDARWISLFSEFVDVPNEEVTTQMIATLLYGQMASPSFPVLEKLRRLEYTAKQRQMFSNLFIFDRCQYVYKQFPSVHTSTNVARPHKQIVFRMAVDGLRKHLRHICEEDVFKGCNVVEQGMQERVPVIPERSELTTQVHDDLPHGRDSSPELTTQVHDDLLHDRDSSPELTTQVHNDLPHDRDSSPELTTQVHDDLLHDRDSSPELTTQVHNDLPHDRDSSPELITQVHDDLPHDRDSSPELITQVHDDLLHDRDSSPELTTQVHDDLLHDRDSSPELIN